MLDPALLMSLLGPEGMASMMPPPVVPPSLTPTGLTPPVPGTEPPPMPLLMNTPGPVRPVEPYQTQSYSPSAGTPPTIAQPASLGAMLEPTVPMPRPRPPEAPGGVNANAEAQGGGSDKLLQTLRGVKAPEAPTPQKVSTPNLPPLRPIQGGGLIDLLASLGIGPQQAASAGLKLPSTLGQALERPR